MMKHTAKIANTDQRCVVVYLQLPAPANDQALIVSTDTLPPRFEQAVMDILKSKEGQEAVDLATVLERRLMPDTGKNVLLALHEGGFLQRVPVSNVLMTPMPNMPFPLATILRDMGRVVPVNTNPNHAETAMKKFNPHIQNQQANNSENARLIAQNLLIEAELLQADADKKRELAYNYAPELRPAVAVGNLSVAGNLTTATAPKKARAKKTKTVQLNG